MAAHVQIFSEMDGPTWVDAAAEHKGTCCETVQHEEFSFKARSNSLHMFLSVWPCSNYRPPQTRLALRPGCQMTSTGLTRKPSISNKEPLRLAHLLGLLLDRPGDGAEFRQAMATWSKVQGQKGSAAAHRRGQVSASVPKMAVLRKGTRKRELPPKNGFGSLMPGAKRKHV